MLTCVGNWVTRYYLGANIRMLIKVLLNKYCLNQECCHDQLDIFVAKLANQVFVGQ